MGCIFTNRTIGMTPFSIGTIGTNGPPLPNHMYFEADFEVFKMHFQYLNTILLYFNPI